VKEINAMKEFQIFNHELFGGIKTFEKDGVIWFLAEDVCYAVGIFEQYYAINRLDRDDVNFVEPEGTLVNESGLYSLIMQSDDPKAKAFKQWITSEVLPSIRKGGSYVCTRNQWDLIRKLTRDFHNIKIETSSAVNRDLGKYQLRGMLADEADMVNKIVFDITAKEWRKRHPEEASKGKNMRDFADGERLFILTLVEGMNSAWIVAGMSLEQRYCILSRFTNTYFSIVDPHRLSYGYREPLIPSLV